MGILSWILFGAIAGWLASVIAGNNAEQGFLGNIVIGIVGAAIGGWLSGFLFDGAGVTGFNVRSFFIAVVGALVLLFIKGMLTKKSA